MKINKWCVMKVLQSKGIVSFDEYNYEDIICNEYYTMDFDLEDAVKCIKVFGINELINMKEYKRELRNYKIKELLNG